MSHNAQTFAVIECALDKQEQLKTLLQSACGQVGGRVCTIIFRDTNIPTKSQGDTKRMADNREIEMHSAHLDVI